MKSSRRSFLIFFGILVFTAVVHADMMPVSQECTVCRQSHGNYAKANCECESLSGLFNCTGIADLDLWSVEFSLEDDAQIGQTSEIEQPHRLTDGHNSLEFCLSALISLGLCCSVHWMKRHSLSFVPEWYHEGGPFQIGHSFAVTPETLYPTPAYCFIQPFCTADNHLPRYCLKTVISIWRKSQFTPAVIASRGPPMRSC